MKNMFRKRVVQLEEINARVRTDAQAFVREENDRYFDDVAALTRALTVGLHTRCLVMLAGPSSSGKTTTARLLRDGLRELGVDAHVVSLDDFYRGRELAPVLEDGSFDYEALEALNLPQLRSCMLELVRDGVTELPQFDFVSGAPAPDTQELRIAHDSVVIFEGIHALNPIFEQELPQENLVKIFINTMSPVYAGDTKLLARRDIRLVRRMLRDERFRNSSPENTLHMWQQVVRGENTYMFPYVDTVDYVMDTTHAYEPCVFAPEILPLLRAIAADNPYIETVRHLIAALERFEPLSAAEVPRETLLREFLGGGLYE